MEKNFSNRAEGLLEYDKSPALCRAVDKVVLPPDVFLPFNRCNLPASLLGSLRFQDNPAPLWLDGLAELHHDLFRRLNAAPVEQHAGVFKDYLTVHFRLAWPEEAGYTPADTETGRQSRTKADYARMLRGWSFDADSQEGAVLKAWVESRFGLRPRFHRVPLRDVSSDDYVRYEEMRARGLYGTNALESQLDLVYAFCQYTLARQAARMPWVTLYRGVNRLAEHEVLQNLGKGESMVLLNNLSSFTASRERACEFGDYILSAKVPLCKVAFYCDLLPNILRGEAEFLVIGGVYRVALSTW